MVIQTSSSTIKRRVTLLAFGFFSLFLAYNTAQLLQTAVNGSNGYTCLGLVYGWFALSSIVSPYFVFRFGSRCLLAPSGIAYVLMTASYLAPESSIFLLGSCFSVGISAAFLWTSQGSYIGECALAMSKVTNRAMTDCTSELNANFYSIFATSSGVSAAFSFAFLSLAGPDSIRTLFIILTLCGCVGISLLAVLAEPRAPHDAATRIAGLPRGPAPADPRPAAAAAAGREEERASMVDGDSLAAPVADQTAAAAGRADCTVTAGKESPHLAYMVGRGPRPPPPLSLSPSRTPARSPPSLPPHPARPSRLAGPLRDALARSQGPEGTGI